jgi:hypothetical protein
MKNNFSCRYEFSEHLTDNDLEQIYSKARNFQHSFASSKAPGEGHRSVVLLNYVSPSAIALKVSHTYNDNKIKGYT